MHNFFEDLAFQPEIKFFWLRITLVVGNIGSLYRVLILLLPYPCLQPQPSLFFQPQPHPYPHAKNIFGLLLLAPTPAPPAPTPSGFFNRTRTPHYRTPALKIVPSREGMTGYDRRVFIIDQGQKVLTKLFVLCTWLNRKPKLGSKQYSKSQNVYRKRQSY